MSSAPANLGKRTQATANATREMMLDAALGAFARQGYEATSLRQAAELAGVSHGLFRKHFGNKQTLWRAAIDHGINRYSIALAARASQSRQVVETIQDLIRTMLALTADHPDLVRIMVLEGAVHTERTEYIAEIWNDVGDQYRDLFYGAQDQDQLSAFIDSDMFLFVLTAGMVPLALPGLSSAILGVDIAEPRQQEAHADRLIKVLFG
ncbi:MAG: TetR/AcrR family transcriptional regulator [Devosiaceae bacterium]|nr:TetR/AcrR family transcriptional regulator [Devosiaceae bacterium MH13]